VESGDVLGGVGGGVKGLYVLVLRVEEGVYRIGRLYHGRLPGGYYVYVGSAWGPGGLKARISRHLRRDKKPRWHIDWLTVSSRVRVVDVYVLPGYRDEGRLASILSEAGECPVRGFGSSDDPGNECHLFYLGSSKEVFEDLIGSMEWRIIRLG